MKKEINPWEGIREDIIETCKVFRQKITRRILMRVLLFTLALGCSVSGCSYLNKRLGLPDDNILEEIIEHQIERKTGIDFDLTPGSKEYYA